VGLFTKVSYLPLLAVPALVVVVREKNYRLAVRAGVLFALLPLLPVALYLSVVPGASSASRDFEHFINAWRLSLSELQHFSIEMVLLFQFWPVLMYLAWQRRDGMTRAILLSAGVVVLSTWAFKLPAVPRLYLPSLAMAVAGSGPAIVATIQRPITIPLVALVALANYSLMIVGTFF
jgi:hypothetical protein